MYILTVENGHLDAGSELNRSRLKEELLENEGKRYKLEKIKTQRSLNQNSYYWLYLGIIERETGNDSNSLHEYFKIKFLPPKFIKLKGKEHKVPRSTTELNKVEFGEYLEKICAECNVPLPNPEEAGYVIN